MNKQNKCLNLNSHVKLNLDQSMLFTRVGLSKNNVDCSLKPKGNVNKLKINKTKFNLIF